MRWYEVAVWALMLTGALILCYVATSVVVPLWVPLLGFTLMGVAVLLIIIDVWRDIHHHR
jgi:hypothetical protein